MATKPTARARRPTPDRDAAPADTFERVIRAVNVAYYEWFVATDEVRFSPTLLDLFGYDPGTLDPRRFWDAMHLDDLPRFRAAIKAAFKSGADRVETTYQAKLANGTFRWVRNQSTIERAASGRVTRMVGAVSDITEAQQR